MDLSIQAVGRCAATLGKQNLAAATTWRTCVHVRVHPYEGNFCRRDPWVLPIEATARRAATLAKQNLAHGAGGCSDHLALARAYNGWAAAKRTGTHFRYASSMFLSNGTMTMIEGMRGQLLGELMVSHHCTTKCTSRIWNTGRVQDRYVSIGTHVHD